MTTKIVALFNLKPGVSREAYEGWARSVDLPTVNALASIQSFEVFRMAGVLGSEAKPPYEYVEIIDVADMGQFGADVASETMQRVAAEFQAVADNPVFVLTERLA